MTASFSSAADGPEFSVQSFGRTYSPGLAINPTGAYSLRTWGTAADPLHGYVRIAGVALLTPTSVGARTEFDFYPVSFLGFTAGRNWIERFGDIPSLDCERNECIGTLHSSDLSVRGLLKVGNIFGSVKFTKIFYDLSESGARNLVDPMGALIVSGDGEESNQWNVATGIDLSPEWAIGGIFQSQELLLNSGTQNAQYLFARRKKDAFTFTVGAGRFSSEMKSAHPSFIAAVVWAPVPSTEPGR